VHELTPSFFTHPADYYRWDLFLVDYVTGGSDNPNVAHNFRVPAQSVPHSIEIPDAFSPIIKIAGLQF
jgi:hypothetical protein